MNAHCNKCDKPSIWTISDCVCDVCLQRLCEACAPLEWKCTYCYQLICPCTDNHKCYSNEWQEVCVICTVPFTPETSSYFNCVYCDNYVCKACLQKDHECILSIPCSYRSCYCRLDSCIHPKGHTKKNVQDILDSLALTEQEDKMRLERVQNNTIFLSSYSQRQKAVVARGKLTSDIATYLCDHIPSLHWSDAHEFEDRLTDWFLQCIARELYTPNEILDISKILLRLGQADIYRVYS